MKAFVDRIEDGKWAVILVEGAGQLKIPAKSFPFKVREGMHLTLDFKPDRARESETQKAVENLRQKLLKKSR